MTIDMTGKRSGRLVVTGQAGRIEGQILWACVCDCGNETTVRGRCLRLKRTQSCGCLWRQVIAGVRLTHGLTGTAEYECWCNMKRRCTDTKNRAWPYYGGRGITVCTRWLKSFPAFLDDMGAKPSARHSIDRIDNDGNYEPENCRWATASEQRFNSRPRQRGGRKCTQCERPHKAHGICKMHYARARYAA